MSEQVTSATLSTRFVARERELAQVQTFLDRTLAGQGQVCFVIGEAGAGKTALVTEFARRAQDAHSDLLVAIGTCNAQTGIGDPYLPFREVLGLLTGDVEAKLTQDIITRENAGRLRSFLRVSGQALVDLGPDLIDILVPGVGLVTRAGAFLAGEVGWLDRLQELTQRQAMRGGGAGIEQPRIFEQYTQVLQALAAQQPLMLVMDDLQWADVSSISLLFHLGRRVGGSRVLIVGTYRPEDVAVGRAGQPHPLEGVTSEFKRYLGDIWVDLGEAEKAEGRGFVDALLDTEPNRLGEDFRQALFRHTGGHPLFATELLRDMQERGYLLQDEHGQWVEGPTLEWSTLPARVEGVIETRIGRLEAELREALTVASVEGEEFTAQVVARVQQVSDRQLVRRLTQELDKQHRLVREQKVMRLGRQRLSLYRFRHNLFQRYLYNHLGQTEREFFHEDVGRVLEELYGDRTEEIAVQLARHFQEAGIAEKAIDCLLQVGNRAIRMSANEEAIAHITQGLALLETLPDTPARAQQELALQLALSVPLAITKGFADPEVEQAYTRARELCGLIDETPELHAVLVSLHRFYATRAESRMALEMAEQEMRLAQSVQDPALLMGAHVSVGAALLWLGEFAPAREHLEQSIALYDPQQDHTFFLPDDPGVSAYSFTAWALWFLGYPDQASKRSRQALTVAQELSNPFVLVAATNFTVGLQLFRRDRQGVRERVEVIIQLSTELGTPSYWLWGIIFQGLVMAEEGQAEEGIDQMLLGPAIMSSMGVGLMRPNILALLAEVYGKVGQVEEGLTALAEALDLVDETEHRLFEAELHRLKGELLLMQDAAESDTSATLSTRAEACFRQAIGVARRQSAKSLELRAATSLSRLLQKQGKVEEARQMLAEIYGWFTEGFDTLDLEDARALLEELGAGSGVP